MPDKDEKQEKKGGNGAAGFLVALCVVVIVGAGVGAAFGSTFLVKLTVEHAAIGLRAPVKSDMQKAGPRSTNSAVDKGKKLNGDALDGQLLALEPMLVNVAEPSRKWLRLEGAILFSTPPKNEKAMVLAQISHDLVAFLRSTSVSQIQSSSGLEFLLEDMSELVRLRTKGDARRFVLKSLVIE